MPAYMASQNAYPMHEYPPQYLEPKYDELLGAWNPLGAFLQQDTDMAHADPYNHHKHDTILTPLYPYGTYGNEPQAGLQNIGASMMPPLQIAQGHQQHRKAHDTRHRNGQSSKRNQTAQDDRVVGGVSAQLDYAMDQMTDFVIQMAVGVIQPPAYDQVLFRKWVLQVLNATRLPSATIILSLSYLAMRVRGLITTGQHMPTERGLYQMLTVALILGSKFLDDNTFQNKSWAEVSNITVAELNRDEMEWLAAFGHRLHHDPNVPDGYSCWEAKWIQYRDSPIMTMSTPLQATENSARWQRHARQSPSPSRYDQQYYSNVANNHQMQYRPTYVIQGGWQSSVSARSPSTAPHSGPTTPEYYDSRGQWGARAQTTFDDGYGHGIQSHLTPSLAAYPPSYEAAMYGYGQSMWNCHAHTCQCSNCRQAQQFQPRYGPLMAA